MENIEKIYLFFFVFLFEKMNEEIEIVLLST